MKIKLLIGLPCLLLFSLSVPVIACECNPLCEGCQSCEAGVCVDDPDLCIPCQNCDGGECVDDDDLCFGCQRCSIGYCEDDDSKCTGECHDGCSNGRCVEDDTKCNTENCEECVGGICKVCGGDPDQTCCDETCCEPPVITSISGPDTVDICEQAVFSSDASDPDGTSLTYSWSGGGSPATGSLSTFTTEWPCKGDETASLTITDNDNPDCCGSGECCSDKTDNDSKDVEVTLPSGCSDCSGDPEISLEIVGKPTTDAECCGLNEPCGCIANSIGDIDMNIATPCYSDCKWRFGVTATAEMPFGPCTEYPYDNYTEVCDGNDPGLTEDNYCDIADGYNYDPEYEETGTGCVLSGMAQYSCTECVWIHEISHLSDYDNDLEEAEALLLFDPALQDMDIDCEDSDTVTCDAAKSAREADIIKAVKEAYESCMGCDEEAARQLAYDCFYDAHLAICLYGNLQGWEPCEDCH